MGTLADLKARIIADTDRSDLEGEAASLLTAHIRDACEYYAIERFWFNSGFASAVTTGGVATAPLPASIRIVDRVAIPATGAELAECRLEELPVQDGGGTPERFVNMGDEILLHPTPSGAFTLRVYGIRRIDPPVADSDSNAWTNEAAALIGARTRYTLYRDVWMFMENAAASMTACDEELRRLKRETGKRMNTPLRAPTDLLYRSVCG